MAELADPAAQGRHRRSKLRIVGGVYHVGDGLGGRKVDPPGKKRPRRELARPGLPGAGDDERIEQRPRHGRAAGNVKLDHILARVAPRRAEDIRPCRQVDADLSDGNQAIGAPESPHRIERAGLRLGRKHPPRQRQRIRPADAHDRPGARAGGGGNRGDSVVHRIHEDSALKPVLSSFLEPVHLARPIWSNSTPSRRAGQGPDRAARARQVKAPEKCLNFGASTDINKCSC